MRRTWLLYFNLQHFREVRQGVYSGYLCDVQQKSDNLPRYDIGLNIKSARVAAGLTQRMLADILDITPQMVQKYEHGRAAPSTDRLQQIATAVKVGDVTDLLKLQTGRSKRQAERARPLTDLEIDLLAEFARIPELRRKRLAIQVLRVFAEAAGNAG